MTGETDRDRAADVAHRLAVELAGDVSIAPFPTGSVPVYAAGDHLVLKLFPTEERANFETEVAALRGIDGALPVPTPRVIAAGARDDWWFVAMSRLSGRPLADAWPEIDAAARVALMHELGTALAALHAHPLGGLEALRIDWPRFVADQRAACCALQASRGLDAARLATIDDFLARWMPPDDGRRVLLHTEVMRQHLLVERDGTGWRLGGLIDFEPAMIGAPGYEFASIGVFVTGGEAGLLRAVLAAYGLPAEEAFAMRTMAWLLLHRYGNLRRSIERLGAAPTDGLEQLALRWFGF